MLTWVYLTGVREATVGDEVESGGQGRSSGLGWKAKEFGLDAEGSGEPLKLLESLRALARLVFGKIIDF